MPRRAPIANWHVQLARTRPVALAVLEKLVLSRGDSEGRARVCVSTANGLKFTEFKSATTRAPCRGQLHDGQPSAHACRQIQRSNGRDLKRFG